MIPSHTPSLAVGNTAAISAVAFLFGILLAGCSPAGGQRESPPSDNVQNSKSKSAAVAGDSVATVANFRDMTEQANIKFTPRNGQKAGHLTILETLGTGVALWDYDGDGDLDLFFPGGGEFRSGNVIRGLPAALYRNDGNWNFSAVTTEAGLIADAFYSHGAIVGDYDSDGFSDLLVTGYGGLQLYHNQGDGTFREATREASLTDKLWSTAAAWGDLNGDGILDLFVAHYVDWSFANHPECPGLIDGKRDVCPPTYFNPLPNTFYAGNGDGTFRDDSQSAGFTHAGKGLGVVLADLDLDNDLDVYITNDTVANFLYRNDGRGRFEEIGLVSGTALSDAGEPDGSMGVDLADLDLDGLPDLWVANFEDQSFALYKNLGDCNFLHASRQLGITAVGGVYVGFGTVCFDFDRDGDEDLFGANGHIRLRGGQTGMQQLPLLFQNQSGKRFVNVASRAGSYFSTRHLGRGVVAGDIDDDGDIDLAIAHTNEPVSVLTNEATGKGHWLKVRLIGTRSSRDAVGAKVELQTDLGTQTRQIKGGTSYLSSHDPRMFFGLGEAAVVHRLNIIWPSGIQQTLQDVPADRVLQVIEPVE